MIFAALPPGDTMGAVLAHTMRLSARKVIKKGTVLEQHHIDLMLEAGRASVTVAKLESGDVTEDDAASLIAQALIGEHVETTRASTGRCNLVASSSGVLVYDSHLITSLNLIDEAITIATLSPYDVVQKGQMVATIKINPFAVPQSALDQIKNKITSANILRIAQIDPATQVGLVLTNTQGGRENLLDKASQSLSTRLENLGCSLFKEHRCDHDEVAIKNAILELQKTDCDPIVICGATATVDRRDVVPAGIVAAGGVITQYGIPVDPGNLLLLGNLKETRVVVMPGCARSLKLNGFDWILSRTLAGLNISREDVAALSVGGLLEEMPGRPLSRERAVSTSDTSQLAQGTVKNIAAIVLAAGRSTRMGDDNKLLSTVQGKSLLRHAIDAASNSNASSITVVTGFENELVGKSIKGLDVAIIHNPDFKDGMSTSVQRGIASLPDDIDGVVVCLGDMPGVQASHIDALIEAFDPELDRAICVACYAGKRGNPVLWSQHYFSEIMQLSGDAGARQILRRHADEIVEVSMSDDAVLLDIDTPQALADHQNNSGVT
jgi:molybdenum cofactor cytidylyltransferase